jgi:hypothetical protein
MTRRMHYTVIWSDVTPVRGIFFCRHIVDFVWLKLLAAPTTAGQRDARSTSFGFADTMLNGETSRRRRNTLRVRCWYRKERICVAFRCCESNVLVVT